MKKILISTSSFGKEDKTPLNILHENGFQVILNPYGRELKPSESIELLKDVDYLIAGTEKLDRDVISTAKSLKIISRCGAGMDNVDIEYAKEKGITVKNTPMGPTHAVAELTLGLILDLLRNITLSNNEVKSNVWKKRMGNLLLNKKVGVIGLGNIGKRLVELLAPFNVKITAADPAPDKSFMKKHKIDLVDLASLLNNSDIITIHAPICSETHCLVNINTLSEINRDAILINTSRGKIIDEKALCESLKSGNLKGAALDVYENEPYYGELCSLPNVILTPHIGSYAKEARVHMEIDAVTNILEILGEKI
jgi:D-3-phosphoglycerate dehydrogenase